MIKNERQYLITKMQFTNLQRDLVELEKKQAKTDLQKLQEDTIRSQLDDLKREILEFESIWNSNQPIPELNRFSDIPQALIKARLSLGWSQKDLADRTGLKEQQIQRYEASEYESASVSRVKELINALGINVSKESELPKKTISLNEFVGRLRSAGLDRDFINQKLLPPSLIQSDNQNLPMGQFGLQIAEQIAGIFGWTPDEIFSDGALEMDPAKLGDVSFKLRPKMSSRLAAHALFAHYLALLIIRAVKQKSSTTLPDNPYEIHRRITRGDGSLDLESSLRYVWKLGIPVIPLTDSGTFQGAHFRDSARSVIVVKDRTHSHARWMFDLFHEFRHASLTKGFETSKIFEIEDIRANSTKYKSTPEERDAEAFANAVLLGKKPDDLFQECIKLASHDLVKLKQAVVDVAKIRNVSVSALANCVAFRLSREGEDWWGAAENLQDSGPDIQGIAGSVLLEFVDLTRLRDPDLGLLRRALNFPEAMALAQ